MRVSVKIRHQESKLKAAVSAGPISPAIRVQTCNDGRKLSVQITRNVVIWDTKSDDISNIEQVCFIYWECIHLSNHVCLKVYLYLILYCDRIM